MTEIEAPPEDRIDQIIAEVRSGTRDDGVTLTDVDRLARFSKLVTKGAAPSLVSMLPLFLELKGEPLTLNNQFPFEDLFRLVFPDQSDYMTGRQIGKTVAQAAEGILKTASIPNVTTLYVTPLYEQIRRFSVSYVESMVQTSRIKSLLINAGCMQNVLHRQFVNRSSMIFSFAGLSADRIRGIPADFLNYDEVDDILDDHRAVIESTISASKWQIIRRTGTPKTRDRTLAICWEASSQAEWFVPCFHCTENGKPRWNIPSSDYHLEHMIGPVHEDISEKRPGTVCYHCRKPISPRFGRWRHRYPERRWTHAGYHIPQIIMPMHYANYKAWSRLLECQRAWAPYRFYNEILGEPYDLAAKLVTISDLKAAANLGPLDPRRALRKARRYRCLVMGVDWGGGGADETSFTTIAVAGLKRNGRIEVIWGKRLLTPHDDIGEAREIVYWWNYFKPDMLAHDDGGAGSTKETILRQAGLPENQIMPCLYRGPSRGDIVYPTKVTEQRSRVQYSVDKSRSLQLTCALIRLKAITFFNWDKVSEEQAGLINDFLALTAIKTETSSAGELYRISRIPGRTDDFAQSVNYAVIGLFYKCQAWPDLRQFNLETITPDQIKAIGKEWVPPEMRN